VDWHWHAPHQIELPQLSIIDPQLTAEQPVDWHA